MKLGNIIEYLMIKAPYEILSFIKIPYKSLTNLIDGSNPEDSLKNINNNTILIRPHSHSHILINRKV